MYYVTILNNGSQKRSFSIITLASLGKVLAKLYKEIDEGDTICMYDALLHENVVIATKPYGGER